MKHIFHLFYHFSFFFLFRGTNAIVPIGGITNPSTRIGREQKVAIKLAVDSFSTIDSVLLLNATDLNGSDPLQGDSIAQDLIHWGAKVIVTTGTSQQVLVAGTTASGGKTPIISLTPSLLVAGPFTFQISYSDGAFVRCIADFVKLHGWTKIITIYEDDALGLVSKANLLLENAIRDIGSKIEYHAVFQLQNDKFDLEQRVKVELRQLMQYESTVYVVLHSSEVLARSLFNKAKELNMMSPRYIWICGDDITDLLNSTLPPTFVANNMQGVVGIKSYINESVEYQMFFSKFQKMFASDYGNNENFCNPGVYAVRAYDAVHAISQASNESKMKNISFVDALSLVKFEGLSGEIVPRNSTFNNSEMIYPVYKIFGIVGDNYANLGFWHNSSGFNPDMKNLSWLYGLITEQEAMKKPSGLRTLRVGIPAKPFWHGFVNVDINPTIQCSSEVETKFVSGFCIDVFTKVLELLKYNVNYQFVAYTTESNSSCNVRTYNDLANLVQSQEVDLVVGDVTIIADRSKNVSFTQPFLTSELVMMVQTKSTNIGWLSLKPFSSDLWICIVITILGFVFLVWLLEIIFLVENPRDESDDFRGSILVQVAASFWLLCNSIFLKIDEGEGRYHRKIVLLWWFLLVQVLLSSFTASLSSILVTEKLHPKDDNLKVGYNAESFMYDYLQSTLNYKPQNLVKVDTPNEFAMAFKNKTIAAAYLELPYLRVFLSEHSNFVPDGESRTLGGFGFVFPKRSPLRADFSTAILRLQEKGTIMQLQRQWFHISLYSSPESGKQHKESILGIENFLYLFIFVIGLAIFTALLKFFSTNIRRFFQLVCTVNFLVNGIPKEANHDEFMVNGNPREANHADQ